MHRKQFTLCDPWQISLKRNQCYKRLHISFGLQSPLRNCNKASMRAFVIDNRQTSVSNGELGKPSVFIRFFLPLQNLECLCSSKNNYYWLLYTLFQMCDYCSIMTTFSERAQPSKQDLLCIQSKILFVHQCIQLIHDISVWTQCVCPVQHGSVHLSQNWWLWRSGESFLKDKIVRL